MNSNKYIPINCSFHDQLLELATFGQPVEIRFLSEGREELITDSIKDVYTAKTKEEFMVLGSGKEIRLDRILQAGNYTPPGSNVC